MPELSDIFTDPEELRVATVVLKYVPRSIGSYPFTGATQIDITEKAYRALYPDGPEPFPLAISHTPRDLVEWYHPEERIPFFQFCLTNQLFPRLARADYIRNAGYFGANVGWAHHLWERKAP